MLSLSSQLRLGLQVFKLNYAMYGHVFVSIPMCLKLSHYLITRTRLMRNELQTTERVGVAVAILDAFSGGDRFESHPGYSLSS
jgi:hypothetical protein